MQPGIAPGWAAVTYHTAKVAQGIKKIAPSQKVDVDNGVQGLNYCL